MARGEKDSRLGRVQVAFGVCVQVSIPSSQRQAMMDRGHSPNSEEVVMDTSQVVV